MTKRVTWGSEYVPMSNLILSIGNELHLALILQFRVGFCVVEGRDQGTLEPGDLRIPINV